MMTSEIIGLNYLQILNSCHHFNFKQNFNIFFSFQSTAAVYLNRPPYYFNSFWEWH